MDPRPVPKLPDDVQVELTARREEFQATLVDDLNQSWAEYLSRYTEALLGNSPPLPNPERFLFPPLIRFGLALFDAFAGAWLKVDPKPTTADYLCWLRAPLQDSVSAMVEGWIVSTCPDALAIDAEARQVIVALWRVDRGQLLRGELAKAMARREIHWRPIGMRTLAPAADAGQKAYPAPRAEEPPALQTEAPSMDSLNAEPSADSLAPDGSDPKYRAYLRLFNDVIQAQRKPGESMDAFWKQWCKKHHVFGRTTATNYRIRRAGDRAPLVEAAILADAKELGLRIPAELDADSRGFGADSGADGRG